MVVLVLLAAVLALEVQVVALGLVLLAERLQAVVPLVLEQVVLPVLELVVQVMPELEVLVLGRTCILLLACVVWSPSYHACNARTSRIINPMVSSTSSRCACRCPSRYSYRASRCRSWPWTSELVQQAMHEVEHTDTALPSSAS